MAAADRAYRALVGAALGAAGVLSLPVAFTFFPAEIQDALHRLDPFVAFCAGLLEEMQLELPPLGVAIIALGILSIGSALVRTSRLMIGTERVRRSQRAEPPPERLQRTAARVGVAGCLRYVRETRPFAHCIGVISPVIVVSEGALRRLRDSELEAVLWHEAEHLRKRDPFRVMIARALGALFVGLPLIDHLVERFEVAKELDADRAALRELGDPAPLAGALLALGVRAERPMLVAGPWSLTTARIDQLAGASRGDALPRSGRVALVVTTLSIVLALALALGQGIRAHSLTLPLPATDHGTSEAHCPLPEDGILL